MNENMAKYTETLADYLAGGGQLPAAFSKIEGFENLFKMKYYDKEIGFETETIFALKLNIVADLYIDQYVDQLEALNYGVTGMKLPVRTQHSVVASDTLLGEQVTKLTDRPIDNSASEPNHISLSEPTNNTSTTTSDVDAKGFNSQMEAYEMVTKLNRLIEPLLNDLLDKFKYLFMMIY